MNNAQQTPHGVLCPKTPLMGLPDLSSAGVRKSVVQPSQEQALEVPPPMGLKMSGILPRDIVPQGLLLPQR